MRKIRRITKTRQTQKRLTLWSALIIVALIAGGAFAFSAFHSLGLIDTPKTLATKEKISQKNQAEMHASQNGGFSSATKVEAEVKPKAKSASKAETKAASVVSSTQSSAVTSNTSSVKSSEVLSSPAPSQTVQACTKASTNGNETSSDDAAYEAEVASVIQQLEDQGYTVNVIRE